MDRYMTSPEIRLPRTPRPIVVVGAGSIVEEAHLPAYQKAGWPVHGIYDIRYERAVQLASAFRIPTVYASQDELVRSSPKGAVYDLAVPASALLGILEALPDGANVMMQKPMGETLEEAAAIKRICQAKGMVVSVNFQMKLIPSIMVAKKMIDSGAIGDVHDMEVRMNIHHPWELWDFLFGLPRMEMLYHSIHYMDMVKYFLGMPRRVYAKTFQHPHQMQLASTKSVIIFDYDRPIRAFVNTNHGHNFGTLHQDSFVKWEGTQGAIKVTLGKNINFPTGTADRFEYFIHGETQGWKDAHIHGHWYPDAFVATMADLQCVLEDPHAPHVTSLEHAYDTMRLVEAAYTSHEGGGVELLV